MRDKNLSGYGFKFQAKIISCIMTDAAFVSQIYDLLKTEYFDSEAIKFLADRSLEYFKKNKKIPTIDVLKVFIDGVEDKLLKQEIVNTLKEAVKSATATDLDFIKETTLDFCKNQELKSAILESVQLLKTGDYDSIKNIIDNALKIGMNSDIGMDYFDAIEQRYEENSRDPLSTGWDVIDEITKGGLAPGELGVAIAPSGAGKSWLLSSLGANALRRGKTVVHYSLELSENYTGWRYDCILTGISLDKINLHVDKVKETLQKIPGKLIIKWFPTKSVSLMGLRSHLTKLKMLGTEPDLVIIDYADLLKFGNSKMAKHEILEALYEDLRGFAGENKVPIWTVSQSNREGLNDDIIEADKAAGAYAKIFPADFVMSLSRKAQDKLSNTARLHIIKNRFGVDGVTFPVYMDTSRGVINVHSETSSKGKEVSNAMTTDTEYNRQRLKQRFSQLNEKVGENSKSNHLF
jgi:replicative DNA helicase